ncbi:MAG: MiaB/RimO family radical SAM methylthiotransferase [Spirochaetes bacterium]|nr:MiaB/RimO family radical SAM methylthiotransferase [Spirochaetota bacterium]
MLNFYLKTFGCRLNIAESESIAFQLKRNNFAETFDKEKASVFIINSCTVTSNADKKVKNFVNGLKKYGKPIFITGCGNYQNIPEKNIFFIDNNQKGNIVKIIIEYFNEKGNNDQLFLNLDKYENNQFFDPSYESIYHTKAFLKIQDGCNQNCSYCKVRLVRGKSVSLEKDKIIDYIERLSNSGFKEIVLTGVNLSSYNFKTERSIINFSDLIEDLLKKFENKILITLSSLEVNFLDDKFFELIKSYSIKPYFHLPIQSGSEKILKLMNREYKISEYIRIVDRIRKIKKNSFISTDVIVGFPLEDYKDFNKTLNICKDLSFSYMHIFPFSFREGTEAYKKYYSNKIDEKIIEERKFELESLNFILNKQYIVNLIKEGSEGYNKFLIENKLEVNNKLYLIGTNYYNIKCILETKIEKLSDNSIFSIGDYLYNKDIKYFYKRDLNDKKGILYGSWY